jgi:hypothetical protein
MGHQKISKEGKRLRKFTVGDFLIGGSQTRIMCLKECVDLIK